MPRSRSDGSSADGPLPEPSSPRRRPGRRPASAPLSSARPPAPRNGRGRSSPRPANTATTPPTAAAAARPVAGRQSRKEATRLRILEAARDLLLTDGVDGFSMRKLAARIGYTATAIYFHFPDKDTLLVELVNRQFTTFRRAFDRFRHEPDPLERIRRMGSAYVDFALRHPDHYRFMFLNPLLKFLPLDESIERGNPAEDSYAYLRGTVEEAIERGLLRPEFADPDRAAQVLWSAVHGLASLHIVKGEDPWIDWQAPRPTARLLVDALLAGMSAVRAGPAEPGSAATGSGETRPADSATEPAAGAAARAARGSLEAGR
ncbi:MAG: TetR/AcrR family transcriptional regulator [Pirellulales bacterium]